MGIDAGLTNRRGGVDQRRGPSVNFATAMQQAGEEQLVEAGVSLRLTRHELAYVLARHRRAPWLLDMVLFHGGDGRSCVLQMLEARPPTFGCR
jgi:hypothetical protein